MSSSGTLWTFAAVAALSANPMEVSQSIFFFFLPQKAAFCRTVALVITWVAFMRERRQLLPDMGSLQFSSLLGQDPSALHRVGGVRERKILRSTIFVAHSEYRGSAPLRSLFFFQLQYKWPHHKHPMWWHPFYCVFFRILSDRCFGLFFPYVHSNLLYIDFCFNLTILTDIDPTRWLGLFRSVGRPPRLTQ